MRETDGHQGYAPGSFLAPEVPKKLHMVDNHYTEEPTMDSQQSKPDRRAAGKC